MGEVEIEKNCVKQIVRAQSHLILHGGFVRGLILASQIKKVLSPIVNRQSFRSFGFAIVVLLFGSINDSLRHSSSAHHHQAA